MDILHTEKYENVILFLCSRIGASGVEGKKKLAKLLYYVDFDRFEFEESMLTITGDVYKRLPMGPYPESMTSIIEGLARKGSLKVSHRDNAAPYSPTTVYQACDEPDMSLFNDDDIAILERVAQKYLHLNGKQLENLSHEEAPWLAVDPTEVIPFELAYYRATDFRNAA